MCRLGSATGGIQINLFSNGVLQDPTAEGWNTLKEVYLRCSSSEMLYFSGMSTLAGNVGQEEEICKAKQFVVRPRVSVCLCIYHGLVLV